MQYGAFARYLQRRECFELGKMQVLAISSGAVNLRPLARPRSKKCLTLTRLGDECQATSQEDGQHVQSRRWQLLRYAVCSPTCSPLLLSSHPTEVVSFNSSGAYGAVHQHQSCHLGRELFLLDQHITAQNRASNRQEWQRTLTLALESCPETGLCCRMSLERVVSSFDSQL